MAPPYKPNPYSNVPSPTADPRQVEGWALTETALRMKAAQREPVDPEAIVQTARINWRLWTIFQAAMMEEDCPLPKETRGGILGLAHFIDKHTTTIIADPTPEKLDVLIKINRELAGGLMTAPPSTAPAPDAAPPPGAHKPTNTKA